MYLSFLINPTVNHDQGRTIWQTIQPILDQAQCAYEFAFIQDYQHAQRLAHKSYERLHHHQNLVVVVIGNDELVNAVINGLMPSDQQGATIPFAFIPTNPNSFLAKQLNVNHSPNTLINRILTTKKPAEINLGHYINSADQVQGYFINRLSIGLSAAVDQLIGPGPIRTWRYLRAAHQASKQITPYNLMLNVNRHHIIFPNAINTQVVNFPFTRTYHFRNKQYLRPPLEIAIAKGHHQWRLIWGLWLMFRHQQLFLLGSQRYREKWFHFSASKPLTITTDHEVKGSHLVNLTIDSVRYPFWDIIKDS